MLSPNRRKIILFELLIRSRYVIRYMSAFLLLILLLIVISSSRPTDNSSHKCNFPGVKDTIYVYDTIYSYDTTYVYDTIYLSNTRKDALNIISPNPKQTYLTSEKPGEFLNRNNNFIPHKYYLFSLDIFAAPSYSIHTMNSDVIYSEALSLNKLSLKPDIGSSFGVGINYHRKKSIFTSGITYTTIRENYDFLSTNYTFKQIEAFEYFTTSVIEIDTIKFINIDTLLATGDTIYDYYYDTTQNFALDSNKVSVTDTTRNKYIDKSRNKYIYIEIPLKYSFTIYRQGFSISPEVGLIPSFFVNSKGKIVSLANLNQSINIKEETRFAAINLSVYAGVKFKYYLTERIDFFTSAFYKYNINSVYRDYPIISKYNTFGFDFGLRYKFLL